MEKFQPHQVLQDPLDHKDLLVQQDQQVPRDQLAQQALQDLAVEHQDPQVQPVHQVHREVLDQQDQLVRPEQLVQLAQQDLQVHKVKQEQLEQRVFLK
jgi:hypothetical protein